MATIPIKLRNIEITKIDHLVKIGKFRSRNQAIRYFIEKSLEKESALIPEIDSDITEIQNKIYNIWDQEGNFEYATSKVRSLIEAVSKDRERFGGD